MPLFVVERELPGVTPEMLQSAGLRAKTCCSEMTAEGDNVRWVRSFFLPADSKTHCYFEASSDQTVAEANRRANIPYLKISQVVEMTPEAV